MVRVALQQRHQRLGALERVELGRRHQALQPVPAVAVGERAAQAGAQATGVGGQPVDGLGHQAGKVRPQPGIGLELEGVRGLVQGDEGAELVERQPHVGRRGADVRLHEVQPAARRGRGGQQADVVLAEHLARQERHQEAELLVADRPVDDAGQRSSRRVRRGLAGHDLLDPIEELLEGDQVQVDPLTAIDHRRRLERGRQLRADLLRHHRLDPQQRVAVEVLGRFADVGAQRRAVGAQPAAGEAAHRLPVDESRAGAPHDLALRDGGPHGEQPADHDSHAQPAGIACHPPESSALLRQPPPRPGAARRRRARPPR